MRGGGKSLGFCLKLEDVLYCFSFCEVVIDSYFVKYLEF